MKTIEKGPFFLSQEAWLTFASDTALSTLVEQESLVRIFDTIAQRHEVLAVTKFQAVEAESDNASRRSVAPATAGALGYPGFLEALINVALGLRSTPREALTKEAVVQCTRELIMRYVIPSGKRADVLAFRATMLASVPLLHAFDVLAEQLHAVHGRYAIYDGTMDAHDMLRLTRDAGLLGNHLTEQQVLTAFAQSLSVTVGKPRTLRDDGSFQECVLRLALSYYEDGDNGMEPMGPISVDVSRPEGLKPTDEAEILKRLAIVVHCMSDALTA